MCLAAHPPGSGLRPPAHLPIRHRPGAKLSRAQALVRVALLAGRIPTSACFEGWRLEFAAEPAIPLNTRRERSPARRCIVAPWSHPRILDFRSTARNGGIALFKSSDETHAEIGDRANDGVGSMEPGCAGVVGEEATSAAQRGRSSTPRRGRINTASSTTAGVNLGRRGEPEIRFNP